jgi:thioredoxin-related protein
MSMIRYFFLSLFICSTVVCVGQTDSLQPPYKRFPTFPPVKLLESDSLTTFTKDDLPKKTAVLLMVFDPDCEHCKHETEELIKNIDEFKKIKIVMATTLPLQMMKTFEEKYRLSQYNNIVVGRDTYYFLPGFYHMKSFPYLAMYDKHGKLLSTFEGTMKMEDLAKVFNE